MKKEMTSAERVFAAIKGKETDCVPAITTTMMLNMACMERSRSFLPEAYTDALKMMQLAETGHTLLGFDTISPGFSAHLEAAALGCKIHWGDATKVPEVTSYAIKKLDEFTIPASYPNKAPCTALLRAIKMLKKKYKDEVPIVGKVVGPWSLAFFLYGIEDLSMDLILETEQIRELFEKLVDGAITFARLQFEAGADMITWIDHVNANNFSAKMYEDILLPLHKKAAFALAPLGPVVFSCFGNVTDRIGLLADTGFPLLHILPGNDIPAMREIVQDRAQIIGTINNPDILLSGTVRDVRAAVHKSIEEGSRLIAPEASISSKTPTENLIELVQASHRSKPRV